VFRVLLHCFVFFFCVFFFLTSYVLKRRSAVVSSFDVAICSFFFQNFTQISFSGWHCCHSEALSKSQQPSVKYNALTFWWKCCQSRSFSLFCLPSTPPRLQFPTSCPPAVESRQEQLRALLAIVVTPESCIAPGLSTTAFAPLPFVDCSNFLKPAEHCLLPTRKSGEVRWTCVASIPSYLLGGSSDSPNLAALVAVHSVLL
jgi:hypothetical protein